MTKVLNGAICFHRPDLIDHRSWPGRGRVGSARRPLLERGAPAIGVEADDRKVAPALALFVSDLDPCDSEIVALNRDHLRLPCETLIRSLALLVPERCWLAPRALEWVSAMAMACR
jgi:hypothetical protein